MEKTLQDLIEEAEESANWRRHTLSDWDKFRNGTAASAICEVCGMGVDVTCKPRPNEINVGGRAMALNCGDNE